jgi:nicotinamidase-related amidase
MAAQGSRVFFACDTHTDSDPEMDLFPVHCLKYSVESEIVDELQSVLLMPGVTRVNKWTYTAVPALPIDFSRHQNGLEFIICGVCTHICVKYTVADLFSKGISKITVPTNCVASFTEKTHKQGLEEMKTLFGAKLIEL